MTEDSLWQCCYGKGCFSYSKMFLWNACMVWKIFSKFVIGILCLIERVTGKHPLWFYFQQQKGKPIVLVISGVTLLVLILLLLSGLQLYYSFMVIWEPPTPFNLCLQKCYLLVSFTEKTFKHRGYVVLKWNIVFILILQIVILNNFSDLKYFNLWQCQWLWFKGTFIKCHNPRHSIPGNSIVCNQIVIPCSIAVYPCQLVRIYWWTVHIQCIYSE